MTDIEIAQANVMQKITEVAKTAGIPEEALELYGNYKAKIDLGNIPGADEREDGHLILVTAITPTPAGEGKTTTTVGLADGMTRLGKNVVVALREPSLGPVFGIKGGAAGGGYAQVVPMEDINLHFTGDFHAIGAANNLLAAMIDNHIQQGNELGIDPRKITWKRCVDMNDRQLRMVVDGLGGKPNGMPREDGFDITVASEIMAVLCLADDLSDLKERLSRIIIGYTYGTPATQKPVTAGDLKAQGAMAALLKDALKPNLVQTLEHTPAIVHGGPFANIAHGCNSIRATKTEDLAALEKGLPNLMQHVHNITDVYHLPCVVAINAFPTDTKAELDLVEAECRKAGVNVALSEVWAKGGEGGIALAEEVIRLCDLSESENLRANFTYAYESDMSIQEKLDAITQKIYHGNKAVLTPAAAKQAKQLTDLGFDKMPVCVAKTQYSFSDDATKVGAPSDFDVTVRNLKVSAGAGFIVALTGDIMTMPGLPKHPAAERIDIDKDGKITGLF